MARLTCVCLGKGCLHHPVEVLPVLLSAAIEPHGAAGGQEAFSGGAVHLGQQLLGQVRLT